MDKQLWHRAKELFSSASELLPEDRQAFLDRECGGDRELYAEVERLLHYKEETESLLDRDLIAPTIAHQGDATACLEAGAQVANRFSIVSVIGFGGTGEVYEAVDTLSGKRVALKLINRDRASFGIDAERQLHREVELAQRVSHPNVCRVHDLYLHNGTNSFLVISMELLEGKTLSELRRQRVGLSIEQIQEIARQLCLGIDAAHAAGVVHRDLKPSNIMIVESFNKVRVVITDFGVAKSVLPSRSQTLSAATVAGTPLYMAPEQFEGRADRRSDLYSLCVILFELVTGQLPFVNSAGSEVSNRLTDSAPDAGEIVPRLPPVWRLTLLKGLARNPADRFNSGKEVLSNLESHSAIRNFFVRIELLLLSIWRHHKLELSSAIFASLVALTFWIVWRSRPPSVVPFSRLVFAGFEKNALTTDPVLSAIDDIFLASLRQSTHLQVADLSNLAPTFLHMGLLPDSHPDVTSICEAAIRSNRHVVLLGHVKHGNGYLIHLELQILGNNPNRPSSRVDRDFAANNPTEVFRAIENASRWVRQISGEDKSGLQEQDAAPEDLTTSSWKALQLLREARVRRARGDSSSALIFVQEALQADPAFGAAESVRGDILAELRQFNAAFEAHRKALALIRTRNISGRERYQIEANFNEDAGDYDAAIQTYRAWIAHFPRDYLPHFYLAGVLRQLGDFSQSLRQMELARGLNEDDFVIYPHLAAHYLNLHKWGDARRCSLKLRDLGEPLWALEVDGRIEFAQGRYEDALSSFRKLANLTDDFWRGIAPFYVARVLAEQGKPKEAESVLLVATSTDREQGLRVQEAERRLAIAYLAWEVADFAKARDQATQAITALDNPDSIGLAGGILARCGDLRSAAAVKHSLDLWPDIPRVSRARVRLAAEIALGTSAQNRSQLVETARVQEFTPIALDFALLSAYRLHNTESVRQASSAILLQPDLLLNSISGAWWGTPGLYRLASCFATASLQSKQSCSPTFR